MTHDSAAQPAADDILPESNHNDPTPQSTLQEAASPLFRPLGFAWLLVLFVLFRVLALLLLRPGGFIRDWSDFDTFLGIARLSDYGLYPFLHYWLEWPPLFPWLTIGAYKLSLLFPPWPDDYRLWFVLILGGVFVLFESGNFVLLYRIARRLYGLTSAPEAPGPEDEQPAAATPQARLSDTELVQRPLWLYALLFVPIYTMLGFFDAISLFFLLLGLDLILSNKLFGSAVSIGVGFLVKVTPIIFIPVAVRRLVGTADDWRTGWQDGALYVVSTLLTILALLVPFLLTAPAWLVTTARAIAGRSSWETVWAVLEDYRGFGVVAGDRLNPAETSFAVHESTLPWWLILLVFGVLYLFLWTRRADYSCPRSTIALTGLTMAIFLLSSKGFSPQFLIFVLPLVILLFPDWRGVLYSVLLTVLNVLEQPLFFVFAPQASLVLDWIVTVRWLILAVLAAEFCFELWGAGLSRWAPVRRFLPVGLSVIVGLGLIFCLPTIGSTYWQRQLDENPAADMIGFLNTTQARSQANLILVDQQDLLHRLYPFLGRSYKLRLLGGDKIYQAAPVASELIGNVKRVWIVAHDTEAGPDAIARNLVQEAGELLMTYEFDEGYSLLLMATQPLTSAPPPLARVASGANLVGYHIERPSGREVMVRLYWWAGGPMTRSYTVFAHVLNDQGDYVAGHDSFPANREAPTHTWQAGHVYADPHLIELPDDIPSGQYRIVVGMYDVDLERLVARGPDAEVFDDYAIPLGEIKLP